jgi:O-antigen/teichoic acid export membrane protein
LALPGTAVVASVAAVVAVIVAPHRPGWVLGLLVVLWFVVEGLRQLASESLRALPAPVAVQLTGPPTRNCSVLVAFGVVAAVQHDRLAVLVLLLIAVNIGLVVVASGVTRARTVAHAPDGSEGEDLVLPASEGRHVAISNVGRQLLNHGDVVIAGVMAPGHASFAAYAIAARVVVAAGMAATVASNSLYPVVADSRTDVALSQQRRVLRTASLISSAPPALLLGATAGTAMLDSHVPFEVPGDALRFIAVLALGQLVGGATVSCLTYLLARGDVRFCAAITAVAVLLALPLEAVAAASGHLVLVAVLSALFGALPGVIAAMRCASRYSVGPFRSFMPKAVDEPVRDGD